MLPGRLPPDRMYPAGEAGLTQRFVTLASGTRLRIVEAGSKSSPAILLVHGWACSAWVFHATLPALAEAGFRAIAVELPGHGLSDKPREPEKYSVEAMRDFVISALDALSLPSAGLIGHSMGASVVVHVADRAPDRVTGVAMIAPVGFDGVPGMPLFRALTPEFAIRLLPFMATRLVVWAMIAVACRLRRPNSRELEEFYAPTQFPDFTRALAHMLHRFDWKAPFPRLVVPRLVMVATKDHLSPSRNAPRYAGDTEPVVLQGAGHMILDELPDHVNAALVDFFRAPSQSGYISRKYG